MISDPGFERDGRRPQAWRDDLERLIAGEWTWEDGQIAGVERGEVGIIGAGTTQRTIYNAGAQKQAARAAARVDPGVGLAQGVTVAAFVLAGVQDAYWSDDEAVSSPPDSSLCSLKIRWYL